MFTNAVRFWGEVNPDFFKGTVSRSSGGVLARSELRQEIRDADARGRRRDGATAASPPSVWIAA